MSLNILSRGSPLLIKVLFYFGKQFQADIDIPVQTFNT